MLSIWLHPKYYRLVKGSKDWVVNDYSNIHGATA